MERSLNHPNNSITAPILMTVVTVVLFFFPVFNGLVGGFLGGYRVGNRNRALRTAVIPAAVSGVLLYLIRTQVALPHFNWWFGGLAGVAMIIMSVIGLVAGAAIGGAVSEGRVQRTV